MLWQARLGIISGRGAIDGAAAALSPSLSYLGQFTAGNSVNIGAADPNCLVIVCPTHHRSGPTSRTISSVTIGGSGATIHAQEGNSVSSRQGCGIASLLVTGGGSITITYALSASALASTMFVYKTINFAAPPTLHDTGSINGDDAAAAVDLPAGGVVVGVCASDDNDTISWTGLDTRDADVTSSGRASVAHSNNTSSTSAHSVTASSASNNEVVVLASFV